MPRLIDFFAAAFSASFILLMSCGLPVKVVYGFSRNELAPVSMTRTAFVGLALLLGVALPWGWRAVRSGPARHRQEQSMTRFQRHAGAVSIALALFIDGAFWLVCVANRITGPV